MYVLSGKWFSRLYAAKTADQTPFSLPPFPPSLFTHRSLSRKSRDDRRRLLWTCFRYGKIRICSSRQPGGPDEHHFVYHVCSFLPLIGLLMVFLPNLDTGARPYRLLSVTPDSFAKRWESLQARFTQMSSETWYKACRRDHEYG